MEADDRKQSILDIAGALFLERGFDKTSISDILAEAGIARGTLYYHFQSKEEIMDELIRRQGDLMIEQARAVAGDHTLPVRERLFKTLFALNAESTEDGQSRMMLEHMHRPENALMHQKMNGLILEEIPPILAGIVKEGIAEGLFQTDYPDSACEIVLVYANEAFGDRLEMLPPQDQKARVLGFLNHLEKLFGAKPGFFMPLIALFERKA